MQLVVCEKPSVAATLAKALGVTERKDGYIEGGNIIVSWCIGHLVELASADCYDERYKKWNAVNSDVAFESLIFGVEYAFAAVLAVLAPASCRNYQQISGVRQHKLRRSQVYDAACVGAVEHCTAL